MQKQKIVHKSGARKRWCNMIEMHPMSQCIRQTFNPHRAPMGTNQSYQYFIVSKSYKKGAKILIFRQSNPFQLIKKELKSIFWGLHVCSSLQFCSVVFVSLQFDSDFKCSHVFRSFQLKNVFEIQIYVPVQQNNLTKPFPPKKSRKITLQDLARSCKMEVVLQKSWKREAILQESFKFLQDYHPDNSVSKQK